MAEGIARERLADTAAAVASAGTHAMVGYPAEPSAVLAAREAGASIFEHRGAQLDADMLESFDRVYVMTARHRAHLHRRFGELAEKVELLDPDGVDIADPYGHPPPAYRRVRDRIEVAIEARLADWREAASG